MIDYALYQIDLSKPETASIVTESDVPLDKAQEKFGQLFKRGCTHKLLCSDSKGNLKKLNNIVLEHRNDIIVWRIHNEQTKEQWKFNGKFKDGIEVCEAQTEKSEPYSYVIINNKPGMLYMAVEKSSVWRSNTNKVRDIVKESIAPMLFDKFNLNIEIRELTIPSKIWDYAEALCKDGNDSIIGIAIDIVNPNRIAPHQRICRESTPELVQKIQDFAKLTGAVKMMIDADYNKVPPSQLKDKVDDIVHIVRLCTQHEFALTLKFEKHGAYKCDENVIAIYPIEDGVVSLFLSHNDRELFEDCPLATWFENSIEKLEKIRNENATPEPKNR